jgi:hypothetical protein
MVNVSDGIGLDVVGTVCQWDREENALKEREYVNGILYLLIPKLHASYGLPVEDCFLMM